MSIPFSPWRQKSREWKSMRSPLWGRTHFDIHDWCVSGTTPTPLINVFWTFQASVRHHSHIPNWNTSRNDWTVKEDGCFEATVSRKAAAPQVLKNNTHLYCSDSACIHAQFGMNQSLHYELTLPLIQPGLILHFLFIGSVTVYVDFNHFSCKIFVYKILFCVRETLVNIKTLCIVLHPVGVTKFLGPSH